MSLSLVLLAAGAEAQAPDEPEPPSEAEREARALFDAARADFDAGRFVTAREQLERSLSLAPRSGTAMNLARVLRSLGEIRGAIEVVDAMLRGDHGDVPESRRAAAETLRDTLQGEVAYVEIVLAGRPEAELAVDGRETERLTEGTHRRALDPGEHHLRIDGGPGAEIERVIELRPGGTVRVQAEFEAPLVVVPDAAVLDTPPAPAAPSRRRRRVLGVVIGLALAAGVGVGVGLALRPDGGDPFFPTATALTVR